ncbi:MAG: hypothetical protein K8R21_06060, partial [Leptospira sp.]|nr:hypothetical protein [Leptospira sp.]
MSNRLCMETTEFLKRSGSIAIFGGGISGRSSAKLLKNKGKRIILIDKVPTGDVLFDEYFSETISMKELHDISTIVKSP